MFLKVKSNGFLVLLLIVTVSIFFMNFSFKVPTELEGVWKDSCQQVKQDGDLKNQISTFTFSGDTVTIERVDYLDENCNTKSSTLILNGTFTTSGESDIIPGVKNIDYTIISIQAKFQSSFGVDYVNDLKFCGYSDWKLNVTKDITGVPGINSKGDKLYDIYKIEDSNKLYIGSNEAVGAPTRPVNLRDFYATKQ